MIVTRFAPSPTGWLHLGHVHAAYAAWHAARRAGGLFLLRIEDIDRARCRPDYADAILEDLAWLGLEPDGPVLIQSAHMACYQAALSGLVARGLVYPCFCSRADIVREMAASAMAPHGFDGAVAPGLVGGAALARAPVGAASARASEGAALPLVSDGAASPPVSEGAASPRVSEGAASPRVSEGAASPRVSEGAASPRGPDGAAVYPGTCRALTDAARAARLQDGAPHAWRLDMQAALSGAPVLRFEDAAAGIVTADPSPFGDVVLGRRDVPASYHLCVVHDDARQGVTLVTRGEDLLPVTQVHVLLQYLLDVPTPRYAHHGLLRDADGRRLSKRDGAVTVRSLRQDGHCRRAVLEMAVGGRIEEGVLL